VIISLVGEFHVTLVRSKASYQQRSPSMPGGRTAIQDESFFITSKIVDRKKILAE